MFKPELSLINGICGCVIYICRASPPQLCNRETVRKTRYFLCFLIFLLVLSFSISEQVLYRSMKRAVLFQLKSLKLILPNNILQKAISVIPYSQSSQNWGHFTGQKYAVNIFLKLIAARIQHLILGTEVSIMFPLICLPSSPIYASGTACSIPKADQACITAWKNAIRVGSCMLCRASSSCMSGCLWECARCRSR